MKLRIRCGDVSVRADVQDSAALHRAALQLLQVNRLHPLTCSCLLRGVAAAPFTAAAASRA